MKRIPPSPTPNEGKNPHAVALGKLGGFARAKALSASERRRSASIAGKARIKMSRSERQRIAKLAAKARWKKKK
jgi:hypothetical protein